MSERKAINKYYPPDYNPLEAEKAARKLSKKLKNANKDVVSIRLMTPFSMRCIKCEEFLPQSRKFNGKKELLPDRYLNNIKIYRLTIRCPRCANAISFRTDPKSADYVMEAGGVRNYIKKDEEAKKGKDETIDETLERLAKEQEEEEKEKEKIENKNLRTKHNNTGEDKMAALEERLVKIQKEQESAEEIEKLRKENYDRMLRAETIWNDDTSNSNNYQESEVPKQDTDTEEAISRSQLIASANLDKIDNVEDTEVSTNVINTQPDELLNIKELVMKKNKITIKRSKFKKGTNPLGIVAKKKKIKLSNLSPK